MALQQAAEEVVEPEWTKPWMYSTHFEYGLRSRWPWLQRQAVFEQQAEAQAPLAQRQALSRYFVRATAEPVASVVSQPVTTFHLRFS